MTIEATPPVAVCVFCGSDAPQAVNLDRFGASACPDCASRVGRLVIDAGNTLLELWPMLGQTDEDDLEPEPKVRRPDGTSAELREVTAELKRELSVDKRMQLAETYGTLAMFKEQIEECAVVLAEAPPVELLQRAFDLLFSRALYRPKNLELLRGRLFPA